MQIYSGGDNCEVNGVIRGRSSELRLACSLNGQPRVTVQEGPQCQYIATLLAPQLCIVEGFGPIQDSEDSGTQADVVVSEHDEL